jgi:hypothetical protein
MSIPTTASCNAVRKNEIRYLAISFIAIVTSPVNQNQYFGGMSS